MSEVEMEDGLAVVTWNDDAPILGFQVSAFNWRLRRAREAKGWTRADLSRHSGVNQSTVGRVEKLGHVSDTVRWKLALALGVPEDVLFPGELDKLPKEAPPQIEFSLTREDVQSLAEPDAHVEMIEGAEKTALREQMEGSLEMLPPRLQRIVSMRFGLDGGPPRTYEEIAQQFGVARERVRQLEQGGLRSLRRPGRSLPLRDYLPDYPSFAPSPKPGECQRQDSQGTCHDRFEMPGWMKEARAGDLKRPMFLCGPCWASLESASRGVLIVASSWREPTAADVKAPPKEGRCKACGEWVATAPGGTTWVRGRCMNKRCRKYGEGQTIHLR